MALDPVVSLILRAGLALLLLSAARHKLRDLSTFRAALAGYALLPRAGVGAASVLLVGTEIAAGASILVFRGGAVLAAALLAIYTAAIGVNLQRGRRDIDCGCAGPAGRVPLGGALIGRNLVLLAAALLAALPMSSRQLVWVDAVSVTAGVVSAGLLYAAIEAAMANGSAPPLGVEGG